MISDSIRRQSLQIFKNIENIFAAVGQTSIDNRVGIFPLWKQLYHLLHSIDQNFVDPTRFSEPSFHKKNLNVIDLESTEILDRDLLFRYYKRILHKVEKYLTDLDDALLEETITFRDMKVTRMELILAQFRHIFFHIGYLHCCLKQLNGQTPEYVGLY